MGASLVDERFRSMNSRFDEVKEYVDSKFKELKDYVDKRFDELDKGLREYVDRKVEDLDKRVFARAERPPAKVEHRLLTKEEWEKLKRFLEKDPGDFTLREAEEFRELGRKAIAEYWERPEAYKLHLYTCVVYGLALRKLGEEKGKKEAQQAHPAS